MVRDISARLAVAQDRFIRSPILRALVSRPGFPGTVLDLSPYVVQLSVVEPPNFAAGYVQMTLANAQNVLTSSPLLQEDFQLDLSLGYQTPTGPDVVQVGRFWLDEPQREFTVNPPKNEVVLQARDGVKLLLERHFEADEWIDIADVTVQAAIEQVVTLVTLGGQPAFGVVFDDDDDTQAALSATVIEVSASSFDSVKTAYALLKQFLTTSRLQAWFRGDGTLRVGMMNSTTAAPAATLGGVTALARPIFQRNHRRSGREHDNVVYVAGDEVAATLVDTVNVDLIGRRKYLFISDPEIDTAAAAARRARQELDLSTRFREQPDSVVPWLLDLERRDLIYVDDAGVSGLAPGTYRVEDLRYEYTTGTAPVATLQLGLGLPGVEDASLTTGEPL